LLHIGPDFEMDLDQQHERHCMVEDIWRLLHIGGFGVYKLYLDLSHGLTFIER
jgi:hypothetical protein